VTPPAWLDVAADLAVAEAEMRRAAEKRALDAELSGIARENNEMAIGKHLHDAYTAAEKALERVVAMVDGNLPAGANFHRDLIRRATLPGAARPPIIRAETAEGLRKLVGFRHVFRHAYGSFDFGLAEPNVDIAVAAIPRLREDLTAFAAALGLAPGA
jgi:hypothetical protein